MADDGVYLLRAECKGSSVDVVDQRPAVQPMQDLCEIRLHSRPEAGGKNEDVEFSVHFGKIFDSRCVLAANRRYARLQCTQQNYLSQSLGIVANHLAFVQQITINDLGSLNSFRRDRTVHADLFGSLAGVFF